VAHVTPQLRRRQNVKGSRWQRWHEENFCSAHVDVQPAIRYATDPDRLRSTERVGEGNGGEGENQVDAKTGMEGLRTCVCVSNDAEL